MDFLHNIILFLHFVGFAALFGGAFVQIKGPERKANAAMVHGAVTQLVTGLLLIGLLEMGNAEVNHVKLSVKLAVLFVVVVLVFMDRRKDGMSPDKFWTVLGLTALNTVIAVFV